MPIYQYECKSCQHELEELQKVDDKPLKICPECNKKSLFRVITGGIGFFISGRTVGAIADKNTDRFSTDFKEHLESKNETKKLDTLSKKLGREVGNKTKTKSKEKAWYKKNQTVSDKKLRQASPEQLKNYIEKGKL